MKGYRKKYRYFNTTFTYLGSEITVSMGIEDTDDDRNERYFASQYMLDRLRKEGLFKNSCIHSKDLVQVSRKDAVSWQETLNQLRQAEERFKTLPSSTTKLVIAMANGHGVTV